MIAMLGGYTILSKLLKGLKLAVCHAVYLHCERQAVLYVVVWC